MAEQLQSPAPQAVEVFDIDDTLLAQAGAGEDTLLSDFTTSVVADQSAEILRMHSLLSDL